MEKDNNNLNAIVFRYLIPTWIKCTLENRRKVYWNVCCLGLYMKKGEIKIICVTYTHMHIHIYIKYHISSII